MLSRIRKNHSFSASVPYMHLLHGALNTAKIEDEMFRIPTFSVKPNAISVSEYFPREFPESHMMMLESRRK